MHKKRVNTRQAHVQKSASDFVSLYIAEVQKSIEELDRDSLTNIIAMILDTYRKQKRIYILGNGGSASIASHMACDLGKGTLRRVYDRHEERLQVISLAENIALLTAYGNDVSFDDIFWQQLCNILQPDDLVIAISGSGNSKNIIRAVQYAKKVGAKTIGFTGFNTGGKLARLADTSIVIKTNHYGPIEDIHLMLSHIITAYIANVKRGHHKTKVKKNTAVPFSLD